MDDNYWYYKFDLPKLTWGELKITFAEILAKNGYDVLEENLCNETVLTNFYYEKDMILLFDTETQVVTMPFNRKIHNFLSLNLFICKTPF